MDTSEALAQTLLIILFVSDLSLLAQWGRKNRGAEIVLIIILLLCSLVVVALGVIIVLVGLLPGLGSTSDFPPELSASSASVITLAGLGRARSLRPAAAKGDRPS